MAVTANGAYSYSKDFPFSAYGEAAFLSVQTSLIAFLILMFSHSTVLALLFTVMYSALGYAIFVPGDCVYYFIGQLTLYFSR